MGVREWVVGRGGGGGGESVCVCVCMCVCGTESNVCGLMHMSVFSVPVMC